MAVVIATEASFGEAFEVIIPGISLTVGITLVSFVASIAIGLVAGLGRVSRNIVIRNLAITYIEFIRGVPIVVLILMIAFVVVPAGSRILGIPNNAVPQETRFIIALSVIYGAFIAEIFRAGVEAVPKGQMEAGRSLGLTHAQTMRSIILPQAIRTVLPALGNDFISLLKDSALATLLGVRDLTQSARLYTGSSFRFDEAFLVLTFLYLSMTLVLSLLVQQLQRRLGRG
ncbi:MAG: amino acid ABC transporter permease [Chloroflexi bacterium]|nr:amino acid ABC transporter permease [Chloroflexota bacterium]